MTYDQPPGGQPWPQQGQPYPQQPQYPPPGYQQPPGYPPQYPPGYPPPFGGPRKSWPRRHPILTGVIAAFGFFVLIGVIAGIAGTASHTVTTGTAGQAGSSPSATASASSSASSSPARLGSTLTLTGNDPGEKMAVTVTRVISHAQPADEFSSPDPGKRFYAVQFRLADTGTAAYSDSPSNGAAVVDTNGQSYESSLYDVAGCQSFPGTENIATGEKGLGCVVFQVPDGAKFTKVQFTLDSGFGPDTGQWDVRS
jgi:Domain of unknown function (DUF4352)